MVQEGTINFGDLIFGVISENMVILYLPEKAIILEKGGHIMNS